MTSITIVSSDTSIEEAENFVDYLMQNLGGFKALADKILINNKTYIELEDMTWKEFYNKYPPKR
jgi:ABC-type molybdate transport system substrate-binding protein